MGAIGAGLFFTGGAPLGVGVAALVAYGAIAVTSALGLPAIYFAAKVAIRSTAKLAWTAIAGPAMDILDNVLRKGPIALFKYAKSKLTASKVKLEDEPEKPEGALSKDEPEVEPPKEIFKVHGVPDLGFSVSTGPKGKKVYTPTKNLDQLADSPQLRALIRSIAVHDLKSGGKESLQWRCRILHQKMKRLISR